MAESVGRGGRSPPDGATVEGLARMIEDARPLAPRAEPEKGACEPISRCLADIEAKPVRRLWKDRIALGKLSIVVGQPGRGKSQIMAAFAARVTTGGLWPDGARCPAGSVILISGEDDAADTIKPRAIAAGADFARIDVLDMVREPDGQLVPLKSTRAHSCPSGKQGTSWKKGHHHPAISCLGASIRARR